ncbi:MAG: cytochrome c4 [Pseudomonadota bacterium]|nr:cytochrome c4 [Pseudomonadota bacterium]
MSQFIAFLVVALALVPAEGQASPTAGEAKAAVCAACHGERGNSQNPEWPKLAGQHPNYLAQQLRDFKSGVRKDEVMSPMAAPLSETDITDIAEFYSAQKRPTGMADPGLVEPGERLYRGGNATTGVPACMSCHGPAGAGNPAAGFPALSGQHAAYTRNQLHAYRSLERKNGQTMQAIATRMSASEIEAVASYIAGLR